MRSASSRTDGSSSPRTSSPQAMPYSISPCNCVRRRDRQVAVDRELHQFNPQRSIAAITLSRAALIGEQAGSCKRAAVCQRGRISLTGWVSAWKRYSQQEQLGVLDGGSHHEHAGEGRAERGASRWNQFGALAVERGGTLKYGRYADSLFLDPVLNDANVDIWILSNLYDTLLLPTDDGKGVQPGLATRMEGLPTTG